MIDMGYSYSEAGMPKIGFGSLIPACLIRKAKLLRGRVKVPIVQILNLPNGLVLLSIHLMAHLLPNNVGFTLSYAFLIMMLKQI